MKNIINMKKVISIILIAIVLMLSSSVYAVNDSFKTNLSANKSKFKRGEQNVVITISLSDIAIESGEKGIGAYTAKLDFDSSVLEYVSTSSVGKWEAPFYQDKLITGTTNDGNVVNTNQAIGTITFKVKDNAPLGETTIKLVNFSGSTAQTDVDAPDSSVKITIEDKENSGNDNTNTAGDTNTTTNPGESEGGSGFAGGSGNNNNQSGQKPSGESKPNTNTNTGANTVNDNDSNNTVDNYKVDKAPTLPKTGYSNSWIYIIIVICALIATICILRIRILNKKSKHINQ